MNRGKKLANRFVTSVITGYVFLFTYAAFAKVNEYKMFEIQIGQSPILEPFAWFLVWLVPGLEIFLAILLCFDRCRMNGMYASVALMSLFTFYILAATKLTPYVPCSCGGILESMGWTEHLIFNILVTLIGASAIVIMDRARESTKTQLSPNDILLR